MNYKTPDTAIFGLNSKDERVFYKDAREASDSELLELVTIRQKIFFFDQVQPLVDNKCTFPLFHMTLLGIKNLIKLVTNNTIVDQFNSETILTHLLSEVELDLNFEEIKEFWDDREWEPRFSNERVFFNLVLTEGKKGVVFDYGEDVTLQFKDNFFVINPGWFWESYKRTYVEVMNSLTEEQKEQVVSYIRKEGLK